MAQPVRKQIQEIHPEMIKEEPFRTLLIDGNSLLFMCFKDEKINSEGVLYGPIMQFLLQIRMMLQKGDFEYVYVYFDSTYSGWLRYNIFKDYKKNRDKRYEDYGQSDYMKEFNAKIHQMEYYLFNKTKPKEERKPNKFQSKVDENFDRVRDTLCRYFNELYIRWNIDEITEGDDQIAYYCLHKKPNERIVIMSGDMDLCQLIDDDIAVYNLKKKKFITPKNFNEYFGYDYRNVVVKKIFIGDTSDNIGNIKGLSEDGFFNLMPEAKIRAITVEEVKNKVKSLIQERIENKKKPLAVHENIINGISNKEYNGDFYEINEKLINLKKPLLSEEAKDEMDNMMYAPMDISDRSFKNLYKMILEDNIEDLMGDTRFASFFAPFKKIEEKEIKRYKDSIC